MANTTVEIHLPIASVFRGSHTSNDPDARPERAKFE
jgi:hypothetical protein